MTAFKIILPLVILTPFVVFGQPYSIKTSKDIYAQNKIIHYGSNIDSFHFRFTDESQAVDIWTNDYLHFNGKFLNFTKTYNQKTEKYYCQIIPLDTPTARYVYNLFLQFGISQIPTQDSIQGWQTGLDGGYYIFQYSISKNYHFKKYWSPDGFKNIKEAVLIDSISGQLWKDLKFHERWSKFIELLPFGCYEYSDGLSSCNKNDAKKRK